MKALMLAAALGLINISVNVLAAEQVFLIDVRTPQEFSEGHLVGAVNIEYQEIVAKISSVTSDKNARIELYCRRGRRSEIALDSLRAVGYQNAVNIGGFEDLRKTRPTTQ
ncbi:MAG: rhodanese-like domain-containing protein [Betaproteobacteria bacterium]|nr:rhodanese-like domain-containing protein [Betaproteobacteria bacterium]